MASRRPTLSDPIDLAIAREIDSKYDDVKIVADNIDKVVVVADSIDRIDDIMTIANEVVTVAEIQAEIVALAEIVEGISALYDDIDVLNSLYADKAKLDSIFADKETLDSLYADKATLDSLYAYKTRLDVLYLNLVQINRVYQSITAVDRVALSADNVDVVADDIVSVNTVSSNINNVVTVSNNIGNVNAVGTDIDSVVAVAQSVVPNLDEILLVDELAVQVATDRDDVAAMKLAVEAVYDSFDDRFLGAKENDPTVDNDGMPLLDGAMYFNTSSNTLKVYDAGNAVWIIIPQLYLSGLLDVTLTSITTGDVLNWNGSKWVNTRTPKFNSVQLNGGIGTEGLLSWNADEGTADLGLPGGSTLQIGKGNVRTVRNSTVGMITNGTVCMFDGTIGNSGRIKVKPFTGGFNEAMYVYGIATQNIPSGSDGLITIEGKVRGIDTTGASVGEVWLDEDILYAKPGDNGRLTKIVPTVSELRMPIASVIKAHTNGTLEIRFIPLNENQFEPRNANIQTHIARADNPHNVTKTQIGLGNVDNTADANKNVLSAAKWTTPRNIALTGDVTGNVNIDGSANVTITTTIQPNSVALGTDTTGNYVAGITQGTGITVSGTAGEGWSPTVAITNVGTAGTYTKVTTNAQGQVTSGTSLSASDIPSLDASKITTGIIDAARLPAFVDDVLEFANQASFPATGESGKIYVALDTNKTYRWSGSVYVYITSGAVDSVNGQTGVVNITTITGNAGTATALQTARTVQTNLGSTASASFNGSANITPGVTGTLPVGNGGTGATTLTGIVKGNGTGAMTAATAGTDYVIPSGSISGNAGTATKLQTSRNIALAGAIVGSVNFDGSADVSISTTLGAQSFIQSSGLSTSWGATSGTSTGALNAIMGTSSSATWLLSGTSGGVFRSGIQSLDSNGTLRLYSNSNYIEINGNQITGNISTASALATGRTIGMTGDVTWTSAAFNGSANVTGTATLANSGVTAGTYKSVTVDAKGRVTAGTNPTTLSGYGISDTYTKTEVDSLIGDINSALDTINGQVI